MAGRFVKGPNYRTPFGQNEFLGSTQGLAYESATVAAASVPAEDIDGTNQKVLQPGTLLARITSGADADKVGPFQLNATDGRQTPANIVGFCNTFLPWQLDERDHEVAVVYVGVVDPERCHIYENATTKKTLREAIDDTDLSFSDLRSEYLNITFRKRSSEIQA